LKTVNVFFCGVDGQGIITASDLLGLVAMNSGYDVKKSEVHGMAQRGGSVISAVRFGEKVFSPLISEGEADYVLSFELLEGARNVHYLAEDGVMILNTQKIPPLPVLTGETDYPEQLKEFLKREVKNLITVDGIAEARSVGNPRTLNVLMLGILSSFLPFEESEWEKAILQRVPEKYTSVNISAFHRGKEIGERARGR